MIVHQLRSTVRALVEPTVRRLGFDLVAVEWMTATGGATLRLSIDGRRGVNVDDCATVSHHVSALMDQADPVEGAYRLEVSSPGMERPVERAVDFERFRGFRAKVRLYPGHPRRRFSGELGGVDLDEYAALATAPAAVGQEEAGR